MKRATIAAVLYVLSASWFLGCDGPTEGTPTGTTRPTAPEKKGTDVHIRTPKVSMDVEHKGDGANKKVEVDVRRKER
jgi:hypothetical protein